ncbi:uncharacterized protein LOC118754704 [Rhagoletis pomonella]|uniref:uncharacterized protein LOC118754688 n=1 Tax=Rhagoletis pomonella TaxID=28610 RepID=UPI00177DF73E|nr:uncharacterized protein LOC118754688 [Rhagoletis pomonella]XP_036345486.1 uncharacterized protein LOC118754704 [Rhagoletis pomonella]
MVPCYKMSKYIGDILKVLISEKYNVNNAFNLKDKLANICVCDEDVLVSFDVVSLFTNLPTMLASKIVMNKWDQIQHKTNIPKNKFQEMLSFCLNDNNYFMFNKKLYSQTFGMPMGNPISPTIADIIMDNLLDNAISELKEKFNIDIKFITKYVDDIFAIVKRNDANIILGTLNKYHNKLQFTMETEKNSKIPFLDVCIHRENQHLLLDWYSKPTSSGRLINYYSSQPTKYKINTAKNLIHKILTISHTRFHDANIEKINKILICNNYPAKLIRELINQQIMKNNIHPNTTPNIDTTKTTKKFYSVTYIPNLTDNFDHSITKPQNTALAYKSNYTLSTIYTKTKCPVDVHQQSDVVYEIKCKGKENEECGKVYIGTTKRALGVRLGEHEADIRKQKSSTALAQHITTSGHTADFANAKVIDKEKRESTRYTLESLRIMQRREKTMNRKEDTDNIAAAYISCL